jgi:hypothetical protein
VGDASLAFVIQTLIVHYIAGARVRVHMTSKYNVHLLHKDSSDTYAWYMVHVPYATILNPPPRPSQVDSSFFQKVSRAIHMEPGETLGRRSPVKDIAVLYKNKLYSQVSALLV